MESYRPSERLLVDDIDEDEREREPLSEPREIRKQAQQAGLDKDLFAHLPACRAEKSQQSHFATTVDDQCEQRSGDAHHRDDHGNGFQRVRDGESAIEDPDGFRTQIAV